ncbi:MAG: hypothetical protein LZF60_340119 [Nitrospira sp.]|nr:DUF4157 domain-containing protein [Nitrospira sp.]ULA61579.1 MAG: hypothetical protein LZF60_340119 [Nitrospira sp.]
MSKTATLQTTSRAASSSSSGHLLQRACACGGTAGLAGECEECKTKKLLGKPLQTKLAVSQPGDEFEQEADRVAEQVMRMPNRHGLAALNESVHWSIVQRQDNASGTTNVGVAPPIVHEVLAEPGNPLDSATRAFFEPRFGHDFGQVRIHSGAKAKESARAVGALAYTAGRNIVFGAGSYAPFSPTGQHLLAHELAHVIQQNTTAGRIQRACLSAAECARARNSLSTFVKETSNKPENKVKAERRQRACGKVPPDPACTGDGHGAAAPELLALLTQRFPNRVGLVAGIFIDKDIPADYGAYTALCDEVTPPKNFPGKRCTFVPESLEQQAKQFANTNNPTIGRMSRQDWLTEALEILTHETEHSRFDSAPDLPKASPTACSFEDIKEDLSELAADVAEFRTVYIRSLTKPEPVRQQELNRWFRSTISNPYESIEGVMMAVRCACDCADADAYLKKTIEFSTVGWNSMERFVFHTEMRKPQWKLNWPIEPPASVDVTDLPSAIPVMDVQDLPKAK